MNKKKFTAKEISLIGMMVAFMAVCAQISITVPFSPVPFTMQTFAVMLAVLILGRKNGVIAVCVYVIAGGVGLPFFANFKSGFGAIMGATGGFIWGFILFAIVMGLFLDGKWNLWKMIIGITLGSVVLFASGVVQLAFVANYTIYQAFLVGAVPYLPFQVVKAALAIIIARSLQKRGLASF